MRLNSERPPASEPMQLMEIVTPRTNSATLTATENFLAAISLAEPFSLEIAATSRSRWFLARAESEVMRRHVEGQLGAAYPQAELRRLDLTRYPHLDPAALRDGEQVAVCTLTLRAPPYLPLRTFRDVDVSEGGQGDPVLGILGALADLPDGWRALSQAVLRPAPDTWCEGYVRLAVEHPLASERTASHADTSLTSVFLTAGLLAAVVLGLQAYQWYTTRHWAQLALLATALAVGIPGLLWLARRLGRKKVYDMRLVQEKINRIAYITHLRLAVFAPADAPRAEVEACVARLAAAYRQFNLAAGNGLQARPLRLKDHSLTDLEHAVSRRGLPILNTRELAGLWHLPNAQTEAPLLERTTSRKWLPLPTTVERGCRIGVAAHQGQTVPVALPDELLRRHLLLVAKTRRGKSSLLLQLARYLVATPWAGARPPALVLVDPHRDLAQAALGLVPPRRRDHVVYLDVAESHRPFGLNLLDVGLGWGRDEAVGNVLSIFRREFDRFWGPRMEDAFRFALLTLFSANQAICAADPLGRARQYTVLAVPALLVNTAFRQSVLKLVTDAVVRAWWSGYFNPLDRRLQIEIVNPVQTKVQRFAGSQAARLIVGQPCSTIDPLTWLRSGSIVIANTAKGVVGEDAAALIGGTLLNLVALAVGEQAALPEGERRPVTVIVDEFHTIPGADYEAMLAELAKYGANLILATQSLARLEALDREYERSLRAIVFANLDGLFAFHTSADDAEYLVRELGGDVAIPDLVEMGDYQCYVKLSVGGERLPPFSVRLDQPPVSDSRGSQELAAASATRYGRDGRQVEADLERFMQRTGRAAPDDEATKVEKPTGTGAALETNGAPTKKKSKPRSRTKKERPGQRQETLIDEPTYRRLVDNDEGKRPAQ